MVIDCWENEPDIDRELLAMADIATPHIAGYSADGKWTATRMSLENLSSFFVLDINPQYEDIPAPQLPVIDLSNIPAEAQLTHALAPYNPGRNNALKFPGQFYWFVPIIH